MRSLIHRSLQMSIWLVVGALALGAGGCARSPEFKALAKQPADYDKRHPVLLTRQTKSAAIVVGPYTTSISSLQRAEIDSFGQAFRSDGEGSLSIAVPSGSVNERAAVQVSRDVRTILAQSGLSAHALVVRPYRADAAVEAPPILLSYTRLTAAVPHPCAQSADIDITLYNQQWENFGCANQTNLAAIVANPNDLSRPRPLDNASAGRRAVVLEKYRTGQDPKTVYSNPNSGTVSNIGQGGN